MKAETFDSSGKQPYASDRMTVLRVVSHLTGLDINYLKSSDKKAAVRAREIIVLLLKDDGELAYAEIGRFLNQTGKSIEHNKKRGARRLRSDEEFAHIFAVAEIRSNTHIRSGA